MEQPVVKVAAVNVELLFLIWLTTIGRVIGGVNVRGDGVIPLGMREAIQVVVGEGLDLADSILAEYYLSKSLDLTPVCFPPVCFPPAGPHANLS
ncbi:MAG: hypothetical protein ACR2FX_06760 [Chthoniobacterales bacterium]